MIQNQTTVHSWSMADTLTAVRMAASVGLIFLPLGSAGFLAVYALAGLTDALDGWLARKTGTTSDFGARLDSAADLLFYGVVLIRLFPVLWRVLPPTIWYVVAGILLVRLAAYAAAAVRFHRFAALHTRLNKLTGLSIFLLPWAVSTSVAVAYSWMVCVLALAASLEELMIHLCGRNYQADRKSIR